MKSLFVTLVVIMMVLAMAGLKSSQVFADDSQSANSGATQSAPISITAPSANPAHGQPGHVCDHGKPGHVCSSPSGPPNMTPGTGSLSPTANPMNITTQASPASTAPGMNPPHGQPNHRCDIGVGVPLDSPAGTGKSAPQALSQPNTGSTAQPTPIQIKPGQSSTPITITPGSTSTLNSPAATTALPTAPGMNPPHGQPNHRCDIGVGVPLDSPSGTGNSNSSNPTPLQISPTTGANGTPSTQKHVHNNADSLNSPPIRIVPSPTPDASKK